jgi:3-oxoadipate enol-lactonase
MTSIYTAKQVEINGTIISFNEQGLKDATPIIFIHDLGLNQTLWQQQVEKFQHSNRIITYDVRGHGKSGTGDGHYTIDLFVEDLISLMNHLEIPKAIFCGLSMGGFIALRAIESFPERVLGLILCETNSYADSNEEKIIRFRNIKNLKSKGVTDFATDVVNQLLNPVSHQKRPDLVSALKTTIKSTSLEGLCGTLLAIASRTDTSRYLKEIKVPTLIIAGEKDNSHPFDSQYLNHFITGSHLHTIKGSWSISNIENPDEFNTVVEEFLCRKFSLNGALQAGTTIMIV